MSDTQEPTAAQKKENIIEALTTAGFTDNPEYPRMYYQINGNIKTVVDLTAGKSAYLYDIINNKKITEDSSGLLEKVVKLITAAEDGQMPTKSDADEVVHVPRSGGTPPPESVDAPPEPAPIITKDLAEQALKTVKDVGNKLLTENPPAEIINRKSTRLNSSHQIISYAVFCLKKKKTNSHRYADNDSRQ